MAAAPAAAERSGQGVGIVELPIPESRQDLGRETKLAIDRYAKSLTERNIPLLIIAHGRDRNAADFAGHASEAGFDVRLLQLDESLLLRKEGHFNPAGNRLFAEYVADWLTRVLASRHAET
jgi:hypothetical protein